MGENRGKTVFVIPRNKRKLRHWFIVQSYWFWKIDSYASLSFSTARILAPIFREFGIQFPNLPFE